MTRFCRHKKSSLPMTSVQNQGISLKNRIRDINEISSVCKNYSMWLAKVVSCQVVHCQEKQEPFSVYDDSSHNLKCLQTDTANPPPPEIKKLQFDQPHPFEKKETDQYRFNVSRWHQQRGKRLACSSRRAKSTLCSRRLRSFVREAETDSFGQLVWLWVVINTRI